jgi:hypothetical protein
MAGKDRAGAATPFAPSQRVEERTKGAAGHAEDVFHAKLLQIINDQVAQCHDKTSGKKQVSEIAGSRREYPPGILPFFCGAERGFFALRDFRATVKELKKAGGLTTGNQGVVQAKKQAGEYPACSRNL